MLNNLKNGLLNALFGLVWKLPYSKTGASILAWIIQHTPDNENK